VPAAADFVIVTVNVSAPPAIAVRSLSFAYPGGNAVLSDLSFEVNDGETVGLVGPNGAGKTTLFLCLAGVLPLRAGQVTLCGLDPADKKQRRGLARQVGIVFQNSDDQLFATTVADDVAFGPLNLELPREEVQRRVREALEQVRLSGFEDRAPHHLSGGEKRRAALAGVLAMKPAVLLLDEPTMFLDPRGRRELMALLRELGGTRLIASHDLELILELCTRTLVLDQGRLMAAGETQAILSDARLMEEHGLEVPWRLRR
jgi:cobalt/nickel transport system ATP-binding protein